LATRDRGGEQHTGKESEELGGADPQHGSEV
jgi:hypothetical protein